ncbi:GNAT family N-acetyltransferase [Nesterenkonia flava]|uniref:GNAT family N-acetyltransferase n=1 Tax=Nesterenkonia flava TaxID=469799 RepID=A0ABU1FWY0_9MICC|nr:GNAT family N-acetyltransferase [Nesterenkonia flava]MDR5712653.1 GNAT family N-acetyltransferase [Nesterenkonia flava]
MSIDFAPRIPAIAPLAEGLVSRSFPAAQSPDGTPETATEAFVRTVSYNFYHGWKSTEQVRRSVAASVADGRQLHGVYLDPGFASLEPWGETYETLGFDAEHPVGTFVDYDKTLNAAGPDLLPARLITGVGVSPSFRRRGILKHMMTSALARAVSDGMPVAALTASEGPIYGRFGFGVATREAEIELDLRPGGEGFALRTPPTGRVLVIDPTKGREAFERIFAAFHAGTRGSVDRQERYYRHDTAEWAPDDFSSSDKKLRGAVHVHDDGTLGGYVVYSFEGWEAEPTTMRISSLVAADPRSSIELWRFIADLDIVHRATWHTAPAEDPLTQALLTPRTRATRNINDMLWVRILNPMTALQGRAWGADGQFTLTLTDPLEICDGTFAVTVNSGTAQVASVPTPGKQHFTMDAETLGALYLGDVSVLTMRAAGRITGADDADWKAFSATFDLPTAPYCATHF